MRDLMKFGMVLVVLAMVTSVGFARTQEYIGPPGGTWCDDGNWDEETPRQGKKDDVVVDNGNTVVIGDGCIGTDPAEPAELDELIIINGGVEVGSAAYPVYLRVDGDLEMADKKSSNYAILNIVNGYVYVEDQSKDLAEDGDILIAVAAGSTLILDDGIYLGDSNDGADSVYTFDIAGLLEVNGDRIEHRGGQLIINLTGDGEFKVKKTSRLSMDDDSVATINIYDNATANFDKIELAKNDDGIHGDFTYSLAINAYGGTWDCGDEDIKCDRGGQIIEINVTGGEVFIDDIEGGSRLELNIDVSSGVLEIDSLDADSGTISITGGDVDLGDVDGGTDITVDGVRVDVDDLKMNSVDIKGTGELVVSSEDIEDLDALIADGTIGTSDAGYVVVSDDGVSHGGKVTLKLALLVDVDIKPGSDNNPLRVNFAGGGVFPVAIIGGDIDVTTIDKNSVTLLGVETARPAKVGDVGGGDDGGTDGTPDLILKFNRADILDALEAEHGDLADLANRAELTLALRGATVDGVPIAGSDVLVILNRGAIKTRR